MNDTRPIDILMLFVEVGILAIMIAGILWGVPAWRERRREEKALDKKLASLAPDVAEALRERVLRGIQLNDQHSALLSGFPLPIIERDYVMGWKVLPEYRKYVEKWAQRKV
jgi:hypothetical protein